MIDFYAKATFELSPEGITPNWGVIIQAGPLTPNQLLHGEILIVGLFGSEVRSTVTAMDPRMVRGTPDPQTGADLRAMLDKGLLTFNFPGQHVQTPDHLRASRFDVYRLGVVAFDIVVTPDNISALREGATLLGSVPGTDMLELYF